MQTTPRTTQYDRERLAAQERVERETETAFSMLAARPVRDARPVPQLARIVRIRDGHTVREWRAPSLDSANESFDEFLATFGPGYRLDTVGTDAE